MKASMLEIYSIEAYSVIHRVLFVQIMPFSSKKTTFWKDMPSFKAAFYHEIIIILLCALYSCVQNELYFMKIE